MASDVKLTHRKRTVPAGGYRLIVKLAREGARDIDVARALTVSPSTWQKIKQRDDKAAAAFEQGRGELYRGLLNAILFPKMEGGNSISERIALAKLRHIGALATLNNVFWQPGQQAISGGRLQVEIRLPGPMSLAEYRAKAIPGDLAEPTELSEGPDNDD